MRRGDFSEALDRSRAGHRPAGPADHGKRDLRSRERRASSTARSCAIRSPATSFRGELFDPVALKIQNLHPESDAPGMINNWDQSFPADTIKSDPEYQGRSQLHKPAASCPVYLSRY